MADMQLPSIGSQGNLIWKVFFFCFGFHPNCYASHIVGFIPWPCKQRTFVLARLVWGHILAHGDQDSTQSNTTKLPNSPFTMWCKQVKKWRWECPGSKSFLSLHDLLYHKAAWLFTSHSYTCCELQF